GGGFVAGAAVLIGGSPGIGKSTLLLQLLASLSTEKNTFYVTGEESLQQVGLRAERLGLRQSPIQMMAETQLESILQQAELLKPSVMVIDS
ncbi:MAG TPA: DNA repair protein RadA, partial [Gammaproteobacteria bacterium]|nr:DNA repair protein RadA [Gammaproteobacteria bacterium]